MSNSATPWTVHGILQAKILKWVAISSSRGSSQPRDWICVSCVFCIAGRLYPLSQCGGRGVCVCCWTMLFPCYPLCYHWYVSALVTQSYLTLCDPLDCSLPGSSIHGILQGRILEWVAIPFSRGSSQPGMEPGSPAMQEDSLGFESPDTFIRMGKPYCDVLSWWKFQS